MNNKNLIFKHVKTEDLDFLLIHPRRGRYARMFKIKDILHNIISIERLRKTIFLVIYNKNNGIFSITLDVRNLKNTEYMGVGE